MVVVIRVVDRKEVYEKGEKGGRSGWTVSSPQRQRHAAGGAAQQPRLFEWTMGEGDRTTLAF